MSDSFPINRIDHCEFYVGNAKQAAHFYRSVFGFTQVAYSGLETGIRTHTSYVLEQGELRFVLTSALTPDDVVARHVHLHGDGVRVIALDVPDVEVAYRLATTRGATGAFLPTEAHDENGTLRTAAIRCYGETLLKFVDRSAYSGVFAVGFRPKNRPPSRATGLATLDHIVGNVELGAMERWVEFFANTMGFEQLAHFDEADVATEYSALMSKVMQNGNGKIKFPINEPAQGKRKSQIQEYLDYYYGAGVQHLALATSDMIATVRALRENGCEFLRVPASYYENLSERVGEIDESIEALAELGILVDRDEEGYLLQIFTQPVGDRPTLFFEVIERHGSRGFGAGNFKALFEALEREQERRGNL